MELTYIDQRAWLISRGALNKEGAVVISNYRPAVYTTQGKLQEPSDCDPISYEACMNDYDQWLAWCARKEYAKKRENADLDQLAETVDI